MEQVRVLGLFRDFKIVRSTQYHPRIVIGCSIASDDTPTREH
jgi:hypothetical protein